MIVGRVMMRNPVFTRPDVSVHDARSLMDKERISRLPVLDKHDKLCGIVTRKDMLRAGPSPATSLDVYEIRDYFSRLKIEQIMERHVITTTENEVVEEAARVMVDRNIHCLPVIRENALVGIITATDLFKVFIDAFGARHTGIRAVISMDEKPGQLARLTAALAERGANIIAMVTTSGDDPHRARETIKVEGVSAEDMTTIVAGMDAMVLEDIR